MPAANQRTAQRSAQRQRLLRVDSDRFFVDPDKIPTGVSYNWKRASYAAKPDVRHQTTMAMQGWIPVPAKRHPEIVGERYAAENPEGEIRVDGQVLCERPVELSREAEAEEYAAATGQVKNQMRSLKLTPDGTLPRKVQKVSRKHDIPVGEPDEDAA